jgi:hypothetical protein
MVLPERHNGRAAGPNRARSRRKKPTRGSPAPDHSHIASGGFWPMFHVKLHPQLPSMAGARRTLIHRQESGEMASAGWYTRERFRWPFR